MSKNLRTRRVSRGEIPATNWGAIKEYVKKVDKIPDGLAVREGSTFILDLGLRTCTVNLDFLIFQSRFFKWT